MISQWTTFLYDMAGELTLLLLGSSSYRRPLYLSGRIRIVLVLQRILEHEVSEEK